MHLTIRQEARISRTDKAALKELSRISGKLYNEALYNLRQHYFKENRQLDYYANCALLKESRNYRLLDSEMARLIIRKADITFRSFLSLARLKSQGKYSGVVKIPKYLEKDGFYLLPIGYVRRNATQLTVPFGKNFALAHQPVTVAIPPILKNRKINEVRILPRVRGSYFEFQYTYEAKAESKVLSSHKYLSIDTGVNNLISAAASDGNAFVIDGRYLKSINQFFNKEIARLSSVRYKQLKPKENERVPYSRKQLFLLDKRNKRINDYISKAARYTVEYCISNDIGNLVLGYNREIKKNSDLSRSANQSFNNIPIGKLKDKLSYLCKMYGITLILQEESFTSKASFFDNDVIPKYAGNGSAHIFSGKRIRRGLYQTSKGTLVNADINGSLNILSKALYNSRTSKADDLKIISDLRIGGQAVVPVRIRLA